MLCYFLNYQSWKTLKKWGKKMRLKRKSHLKHQTQKKVLKLKNYFRSIVLKLIV